MSAPLQVIVGIAVLGWIVWNQLRVRQFSVRRLRVAAVLGVVDLLARAIAPSADAVDASSVLLFIAVSLGVQGLMTLQRARALPGARVLDGVRT